MQKTTAASSKADRIEFWDNSETKEPPMVILVFKTWDDILNSKSHEIYNSLLDKTDHKSTFLKIEEVNGNVTMSFVDGKNDIHFSVKNLKYSKNQLDKFFNNIVPNRTFGFVFGLHDSNSNRPMLAPTKKEFEIMTLAGIIK